MRVKGVIMSLALHYWMGDAHHCSGPPVSEMTYTVSSGTLNSNIPYHDTSTIKSSSLCRVHQPWSSYLTLMYVSVSSRHGYCVPCTESYWILLPTGHQVCDRATDTDSLLQFCWVPFDISRSVFPHGVVASSMSILSDWHGCS